MFQSSKFCEPPVPPSSTIFKNLAKKPSKLLIPRAKTSPLPNFQFGEYITKKRNQINKALKEAIPLNPHAPVLDEAIRYSLLGEANRIYPILCMASCEAVGGKEPIALSMACAFEMLVVMGNAQDDLPWLDNDDFRLGKQANHKVFGPGTTILACQSLLCLAIDHIVSTAKRNVSSEKISRAIEEICVSVGSRGSSAGQVLDLESEGKEVSLRELEVIHRLKTGGFIEAGVVCSGVLGGGSEVEIEKLRNYGKLVGMAAQVCDDVLDVIGCSQKMGKKVGRDALRDKATFVKFMGVDESRKYAMELVDQAYLELSSFDSARAAPLYHIAHSILCQCD